MFSIHFLVVQMCLCDFYFWGKSRVFFLSPRAQLSGLKNAGFEKIFHNVSNVSEVSNFTNFFRKKVKSYYKKALNFYHLSSSANKQCSQKLSEKTLWNKKIYGLEKARISVGVTFVIILSYNHDTSTLYVFKVVYQLIPKIIFTEILATFII